MIVGISTGPPRDPRTPVLPLEGRQLSCMRAGTMALRAISTERRASLFSGPRRPQLRAKRLIRLEIAITSSIGSIGLGTYTWKPALRTRVRSSSRV